VRDYETFGIHWYVTGVNVPLGHGFTSPRFASRATRLPGSRHGVTGIAAREGIRSDIHGRAFYAVGAIYTVMSMSVDEYGSVTAEPVGVHHSRTVAHV